MKVKHLSWNLIPHYLFTEIDQLKQKDNFKFQTGCFEEWEIMLKPEWDKIARANWWMTNVLNPSRYSFPNLAVANGVMKKFGTNYADPKNENKWWNVATVSIESRNV